ncbi:hypothetical protein JX265_004701 [Neoarthrinium moseri]|uniref:Uncharacterized protein n=1 Tax=Neoarthrinium moseri TaxID=1658444 RepID=A0A9P9WQA9_9PEZI|nr:hypothetical protein JX265_004701 [Neoarthrinium moseri]
MSSDSKLYISDACEAFWLEYYPQKCPTAKEPWLPERKPLDGLWLPPLKIEMKNYLLYDGATFNPGHKAHAEVLKVIYDAANEHIIPSFKLEMNLAGSLIGCSADNDLERKVMEQNKDKEGRQIFALPSKVRLDLWCRGIQQLKLSHFAYVGGFSLWSDFWLFVEFLETWKGGKYRIRFIRVVKIDRKKDGHSKIFERQQNAQLFEPLYYKDTPGSGQTSKPTEHIGMEITIATNSGGQGSWMDENTSEPRKLLGHTNWEPIKRYGGSDGDRGIWRCERVLKSGDTHKVFYVHVKEDPGAVQSVDAWSTLADKNASPKSKLEQLGNAGVFAPEIFMKEAEEMRASSK